MSDVKPIGDMVLVSKHASSDVSEGGVYIPGGSQSHNTGKVIAVGDGKMTDSATVLPMRVKVGDNIIFNHRSGVEVKVDDGEYLLIPEGAIYAVLND